MTKQKYYKLIETYNSLIKNYQYNSIYCDLYKVNTVKTELLLYIKKALYNAKIKLCQIHNDLYEENKYKHIIIDLEIMKDRVDNNTYIEQDLYKNTYVNSYLTMFGIPMSIIIILVVITFCTIIFL